MSLNNEVIMEEIEALQAIMPDEVDVNHDESGHPNAVKVTVTPATAQNIEEQHVRVTLIVDLPPNYPDEVPSVTMRNPKGIDEDVVRFINREIEKKCEEFVGCPVIYELIELVRENLTANNTPSCPCAICLFHFTESDTFSKTPCFHYFHSFCLGRYILNCEELAAAAEEQMSQQPAWMTREKRQLLCPVCREPLQDQLESSRLLENPPPEEGELLEDFSPESPEIKALQNRMSTLYLEQKAKGGIIDLEEEKNRFLISAPEENDVEENFHRRFRFAGRERAPASSNLSFPGRYGSNPKKKSNPNHKNQGKKDPGGGGYHFWNSGRGRNGPKRGNKSQHSSNVRLNGLQRNNPRPCGEAKIGTANVIEDKTSSRKQQAVSMPKSISSEHYDDRDATRVESFAAEPRAERDEFRGPTTGGGRPLKGHRNQPRGSKGRNKAATSHFGSAPLEDKMKPQASS